MIGRIQDKNVSVPFEGKSNTQVTSESLIQADGKQPATESLGVARVQDSFEKVNERDLLQQIGLSARSILDPIGYPGEEWLWQETSVS